MIYYNYQKIDFLKINTLKNNKTAMQIKPNVTSQNLVSWIFSAIFIIVGTKPSEVKERPRRPLICETTMITDVAVVNPTVTGCEINSTRTPKTIFFQLIAL